MVEHLHGMQGVSGSNPLGSIKIKLLFNNKSSQNNPTYLYISNAVGVKDKGTIIKDKNYKYGLKLNIIF